jgi:autotransporter-associated beta strand protein
MKNSGVNTRLDFIAMKKTSIHSMPTRLLIAALASTALLASHSPAFASGGGTFTNYTITEGLGDNWVNGVYADGSAIYAATDGGLSISTNGGTSFINRTTAAGLGGNITLGVYANGSSVYAATAGGLSISTDGGASFINRTTSQGLGSNSVYGVYANGSSVYAATPGGLSISINGGTSFINRTTSQGLGSNGVYEVYADGSAIYAATNGGLSISIDGGTSFINRTTSNGLGSNAVYGVYANGSSVYAATVGGLSISTDGGTSFTNRSMGDPVWGVYANGSSVYAATTLGLSISTDSGGTFTNYTTAEGLGDNWVLGVYASGSSIYAATMSGLSIGSLPSTALFWRGSAGNSWTAANNWATDLAGTTTGNFTAGSDIVFSATGSSNSTNTNLGGDQTIASLTINTTSAVGISGGNLTINGTSATAVTVGAAAGNVTISAPLILSGSATTFDIANQNTTIASVSTSNGLVKTGNGSLTLSGNNTYTGGTTISSGTLVLASGGSISHSLTGFHVGGAGENAAVILNGGSISNFDGYIGFGNGSAGTVNMNSGNWTNGENLRVGYYGNGTLNLTGGSISNVNGVIGRYGASNGVANVSGGTWSSSGNFRIGQEATGTLNLTGGNVVVASGSGNVTIGVDTGSSGTLNIGTGSTVGTMQAARVTGGNGTAVVNFNHTVASHTFSPILAGSLAVNKLGNGTTALTGNNTYTGGTTISSGTLWAKNSQALGTGNVLINGGTLMTTSSQEAIMGNLTLSLGGNLTWTSGKIGFYDTESSPESGNLTINVAGNFTTSGDKTFDFSQVAALAAGNYTLVNATTIAASGANFTAVHGINTTLYGNFTTTANTVIYTVTGSTSGGSDIQNNGGPNTPVIADYNVTMPTITVGANNTVNSLNFSSSAPLAIQSGGQLTVSSGTLAVQSGSSVVSGGTLNTPGNLDKTGSGELDLQSNTNVNGIANVVAGLLSVNGQLNANSVAVDPNATLGGAGVIVASNVVVNGNLSPGNSPGTLNVVGNLVLTGANSTIIEIASPTNFDRIVVTGTATLGGTLNAVGYGGYTIAPGTRYDFLQAGSIVGEYSAITAPDGLRVRFLNSGTVGTLLFGPGSYVPMAINQNQRNLAKALDAFILATSGDQQTVSIALDSLTTEQFPAAFDQIMPGFYESLADIAIEQTYNQAQLLTQRMGSLRLGATGFQAIGLSQPIKYDKDGKSAADAKTASPILESAMATNWNSWVMANGEFSISRGLAGVPNYNNNAGGFLVGADYRMSENFVAGLFAGYEYSYAKYDGGSSTRGNSALFGLYGSYTHEDGYYADAIVSGGYTGFQTRRSIEFGTIDRTARANPNSGQFSAALNLGKDFEVGKFTLGPIVGAQYTYAGIGSFTESGAESLDLALGQQNANSLRSNLGARFAYNWEVGSNITLIPEVRAFWMHEFLNNSRNISSALDGGNGASFDYETEAPYRNSVFGGVGVSAKVGDRWNASVFYNVNFGSENYSNNIISTSLGFSF